MRVWISEEVFKTNEQSYKGWEKGGSAGGEIHDIVAENPWLNVSFTRRGVIWRVRFEFLTGGNSGYIGFFAQDNGLVVRFGKGYSCFANESFTISTKGLHKLADLLTRSVRSSYCE